MATSQPKTASRYRKQRLNKSWQIELWEIKYPGNKWERIKSKEFTYKSKKVVREKWIYVFHIKDKLTLLDEIYAKSDKDWYVYHAQHRGKRLGPKDPKSGGWRVELMTPNGYVPPADYYDGTFYFYLSPCQLGGKAVETLIEWTNKEKRSQLENDFKDLTKLAEARYKRDVKKFGSKARRKLVWEDVTTGGHLATTRAAFNFDADGQRVAGFGLAQAKDWQYVVLLQDPRDWAEDIKVHGIDYAKQLFKEYAANEDRQLRAFIARSLSAEIEKKKAKVNLAKELLKLEYGWTGNLDQDRLAADQGIRQRLGWKRFVVDDHLKGNKARARSGNVWHSIRVNERYWADSCSYAPNIASLYLRLDRCRATAYLENTERYVRELHDYITGLRFRAVCVEHCHAVADMCDLKDDHKATREEKIAIINATEGLVHWTLLLDKLHETPNGRRIIKEIAEAANEQDRNGKFYYCLARALMPMAGLKAPASSAQGVVWTAGFYKKCYDNLFKRSIKSTLSVLEWSLVGLLDESFKLSDKPANRIQKWSRAFYKRLFGNKWNELRNKVFSADLKARRRYLKDLEKYWDLNTAQPTRRSIRISYENAKTFERNSVYASGKSLFTTVGAALTFADAIWSFYKLYDSLYRRDKVFSAANARRTVYAFEAAHKILTALARQRHATTSKAWLQNLAFGKGALSTAGKVLGAIGTLLDIGISLQAASNTNNLGVKAGHGFQAAGAACGLITGLWGSAAVLSGGIGLIFIAAYFAFYLVGQVFIWTYSFDSWRKMARASFLGIDGRGSTGTKSLHNQQGWIIQLYSAFEIDFQREDGSNKDGIRAYFYPPWPLRVSIKPNMLSNDACFELTLKGSRQGRSTKIQVKLDQKNRRCLIEPAGTPPVLRPVGCQTRREAGLEDKRSRSRKDRRSCRLSALALRVARREPAQRRAKSADGSRRQNILYAWSMGHSA